MKRGTLQAVLGAAFAAAFLAGPGPAQGAVKYLLMDEFKPHEQQLPGGTVVSYAPYRLNASNPASPLNSYAACAPLRLPAGSLVREITYASSGSSGSSVAELLEFRYSEYTQLRQHAVNPYPAAQPEQTMLAATDAPIPIRRGYRYTICVYGQAGALSNEFLGFKVRYTRP